MATLPHEVALLPGLPVLQQVSCPDSSECRVSSALGVGVGCLPCDLGLVLGSEDLGDKLNGSAAACMGGALGEGFLGMAAC